MHFRAAFSLVELSIVLVILGLLVGGVLSGQSLIHAADLRGVMNDMSRFRTASLTFRDKYFFYPGDMNNATTFWGSAGGTGNDAACNTAISAASKAVCNGDGDGWINTSSTAGVLGNERFYAWKELSNAGMIEGSYSGKNSGWGGSPGVDVPKSRLNGVFGNFSTTSTAESADIYIVQPSNTIFWSSNSTTSGLSPQDAWNVDTKLDDGKPSTGISVTSTHSSGFYWSATGCTDASTPPQYNLTSTSGMCLLWITVL